MTLTDDDVDDKATALLHSAIDDAEKMEKMQVTKRDLTNYSTVRFTTEIATACNTNHEVQCQLFDENTRQLEPNTQCQAPYARTCYLA